jgi:hypothetical protein
VNRDTSRTRSLNDSFTILNAELNDKEAHGSAAFAN